MQTRNRESRSVEPVQTGSPSFRFAVIITVDTLKRFPKRGVYLFSTPKEATKWAAAQIREQEPAWSGAFATDTKLLEEFQFTLSPTEFFHVEKVRKP